MPLHGALTAASPSTVDLGPQSAIAQILVEHSLFVLSWQIGIAPVLAESTAIAADFSSSLIYVSAVTPVAYV